MSTDILQMRSSWLAYVEVEGFVSCSGLDKANRMQMICFPVVILFFWKPSMLLSPRPLATVC